MDCGQIQIIMHLIFNKNKIPIIYLRGTLSE